MDGGFPVPRNLYIVSAFLSIWGDWVLFTEQVSDQIKRGGVSLFSLVGIVVLVAVALLLVFGSNTGRLPSRGQSISTPGMQVASFSSALPLPSSGVSLAIYGQQHLIDVEPVTVSCSPGQMIGDLDGNGRINAMDSLLATKMSLGLIPAPSNLCCVDMDENGRFTAADAALITKTAEGRYESPGSCPENGSSGGFSMASITCFLGRVLSTFPVQQEDCMNEASWHTYAVRLCDEHCPASLGGPCGVASISYSGACE